MKVLKAATFVLCVIIAFSFLASAAQTGSTLQTRSTLQTKPTLAQDMTRSTQQLSSAGSLSMADMTALAMVNGETFGAGKGQLAKFDQNGVLVQSTPLPFTSVAGIAAYSQGTLLVGNSADNTVYKFDPSTSKSELLLDLKQVDTTGFIMGGVLQTGTLESLASDGTSVFVGIGAGYSSSIFKLDPTSGKVLSHAWAPGPDPTAMGYGGGNLFVADAGSMELRRYDEALQLSAEPLQLDTQPKGIAVEDKNVALLNTEAAKLKVSVDASSLIASGPVVATIDKTTLIPGIAAGVALRSKKVAVLICGDVAESGYDEFWSDTCWMYKTLVADGYAPENIYVLYGDGTDYASANPVYQNSPRVTDFSATTVNVDKVLDGLKNGDAASGITKMTSTDTLFVWTFDHGANSGMSYLCLRDGWMDANHFATKLNAIPYQKRAIFMQQCFSGGFVTPLQGTKSFVSTASSASQVAHRADTEFEVYGGRTYHHGEYNYYITCAMSGKNPSGAAVNADTTGDVKVSALEAHNWMQTHENQPETPQMSDIGGIGSSFMIKG